MLDESKIQEVLGAPLMQSKNIPFCITDNGLRFVYANTPFLEISEFQKHEIIGKSIAAIIGKKLLKTALFEFLHWLKTGKSTSNQWYAFTKTGKKVYATIETKRITIDGKKYTLSITLDVTTEAELETKLSKAEDLNRLAEKITNRGNFEYNLTTGNVRWTEGLFDIFELPYSTIVPTRETQKSFFSNEEWEYGSEQLKASIANQTVCSYQTQIHLPNGRIKHLQIVGKMWENTHVFHGSISDITEKKIKEYESHKNEQSFKNLTESLPHIICSTDQNLTPVYMNKVGLDYFGKTAADFKSWSWAEFHPSEEFEELKTKWKNIGQVESPIVSNVQLKNSLGSYRFYQTVLFPQKNASNTITGWTFIGTDIHKQITAQLALEKSNNRLRALIDASPVAIYSISLEGIVKDFWNPAAERILGWTKEEVLGKFLPHISSSNMTDFRDNAKTTIENGQVNRILRRTRKSGEEIIADISGGAIYNEHGAIDEILVTLMDVTELITQREQLQDSLKEKNTLLQEIHHRVKNNLAIIVSMLQLQVFQSTNTEEKNKLMDAQNRIKSIAMVHELLYSTDEFNKINLHSYYENLLESIKTNLSVGNSLQNVHHQISIKLESLNINQAIPLGLLINELVTNTLKYAFPQHKEHAAIRLSIFRDNDTVRVAYSDNGVGFDITHQTFKKGLGLQIIDSLLSQLEATYEIVTENGFSLTFNFPLSAEKA